LGDVAGRILGMPSGVSIPIRRPMRREDEIEAMTMEEIRMEAMKLKALREENQAKEMPTAPTTQHQVLQRFHQWRSRGIHRHHRGDQRDSWWNARDRVIVHG
jgi:hypothetical protein